jgi:sulfite reductase (ferredoxin)
MAPSGGKPQAEPVLIKDFCGVACPMNFVKTKVALESLTSGQRLKVLLDDGAPIQNVPRSVAEDGHKILEQVKEGNHWSVLIEKR